MDTLPPPSQHPINVAIDAHLLELESKTGSPVRGPNSPKQRRNVEEDDALLTKMREHLNFVASHLKPSSQKALGIVMIK